MRTHKHKPDWKSIRVESDHLRETEFLVLCADEKCNSWFSFHLNKNDDYEWED